MINKPQLLHSRGPLLLACNHPNTFLDGMILTTLFDYPVYSLARGDVFKNPKVGKILNWLKLLPVYRTTEGIENLGHNYTTFETCRNAFQKQAIVLIFSEAGSSNEWHLRPLRKGTARLAVSSWHQGIPLKVLPVALNYDSFKRFGKIVHLYFGSFIEAGDVMDENSQGKQLLAFNSNLQNQLQQYVYEIDPEDRVTRRQKFYNPPAASRTALLALPALTGWLTHLPFFATAKIFTGTFFKNSDHYDSVLTSILLLFYPLYLLLVMILLFPVHPLLSILSFFLLPFTAWAFMQLKRQ